KEWTKWNGLSRARCVSRPARITKISSKLSATLYVCCHDGRMNVVGVELSNRTDHELCGRPFVCDRRGTRHPWRAGLAPAHGHRARRHVVRHAHRPRYKDNDRYGSLRRQRHAEPEGETA